MSGTASAFKDVMKVELTKLYRDILENDETVFSRFGGAVWTDTRPWWKRCYHTLRGRWWRLRAWLGERVCGCGACHGEYE